MRSWPSRALRLLEAAFRTVDSLVLMIVAPAFLAVCLVAPILATWAEARAGTPFPLAMVVLWALLLALFLRAWMRGDANGGDLLILALAGFAGGAAWAGG